MVASRDTMAPSFDLR